MYYAVTALLLKQGYQSTTHNGVKTQFSEHFIKPGQFSLETGKTYAQLFTWRQKGDYADLFDFTKEKVQPYFEPVERFILIVENSIL